jgi:hypothetical protein
MTMQHQIKHIRYKSYNNHFTWKFCTIHPRYWKLLHCIAHTHRMCMHT